MKTASSLKDVRVARIRNLAKTIFDSEKAISHWLLKVDPALGNRAPIDLLDTDAGAREVADLIQSASHGQFV